MAEVKMASSRRTTKRNPILSGIFVKEETKALVRKVSAILTKAEGCRTEEDWLLLQQSEDVVELIRKRIRMKERTKQRHQEVEDFSEVFHEKCEMLASIIENAKSLVVYTGAGISTSASIPDYRGPNGVWTLLKQGKQLASVDVCNAQPTFTHMAIVKLYQRGYIKQVVSQNCDGLHLRSGLPRSVLSELHGNMYIEVCSECKPQVEYARLFDVTEKTAVRRHKTGRFCHRCGSALLDTIVHFGERGGNSSPYNWSRAVQAANTADVILCLGSSLKVLKKYSCLWSMHKPLTKRPRLCIVNLQWTPKDNFAALKINGKCDDVMHAVMKLMKIDVKPYSRSVDPIFSLASSLKANELKTATKNMLSPPESDSKTSDERNHPDDKFGKCWRLYKRKKFTATRALPPQCAKASSSSIFLNRPSHKFAKKQLATYALKMRNESRYFRNFAEKLESDPVLNDFISVSKEVASSEVVCVKQPIVCAKNGSKGGHADQNQNTFLYCPSGSHQPNSELTSADVKLAHDTSMNIDSSSAPSGFDASHEIEGCKIGLPLYVDESKRNREAHRNKNCLSVYGVDSRALFGLLPLPLFRISNEKANGCVVNACFTHRIVVVSRVNKEVQVDSLAVSDADVMMSTDIEYVAENNAPHMTQVPTVVLKETSSKSVGISLVEKDCQEISELMPNLVNLDCFKLISVTDDIQRSCRCFGDTLLHTPQSERQQHWVKIDSETKNACWESCTTLSDLREMHCALFDAKQHVHLLSNLVPTISSANIWSTESSVLQCENVILNAEVLRLVHSYCQRGKLNGENDTRSNCSAEMLACEEKSLDIVAERRELEALEMRSPGRTLICLSRVPLYAAECVGPKNDVNVNFSSSTLAFNCNRGVGCTVNVNPVQESPAVASVNQSSFIQQKNDSNAASMPGWFGKGLGMRKPKRRRTKYH